MSRSVAEHGIYVGNSGDRPVIRSNHVWGNSGSGIHMNGDLSQGGDGVISGAVVEGNVIHGNGRTGGSGINGDGLQSSRIVRGAIDISAESLSGFVSESNAVTGRFTMNGGNSVLTLAAWRQATGQDLHSFTSTAAALFADTAAGGYHLRGCSGTRHGADADRRDHRLRRSGAALGPGFRHRRR
jgi:hypothetical protein